VVPFCSSARHGGCPREVHEGEGRKGKEGDEAFRRRVFLVDRSIACARVALGGRARDGRDVLQSMCMYDRIMRVWLSLVLQSVFIRKRKTNRDAPSGWARRFLFLSLVVVAARAAARPERPRGIHGVSWSDASRPMHRSAPHLTWVFIIIIIIATTACLGDRNLRTTLNLEKRLNGGVARSVAKLRDRSNENNSLFSLHALSTLSHTTLQPKTHKFMMNYSSMPA
jgi:hypothetical protein